MFRLGVGYGCIVGRLVFPWYRPAWLLPGILFLPLVLSVGPARAEGEIILHFKDFADMLAKAEAGDRDAETAVGLAYLKGKDVAADPAKAVRFLTAAAEHGSALAAMTLAYAYTDTAPLQQDFPKARQWLKRAAELGDPRGQESYGIALAGGMGGPADPAEAVIWYRRAADQGEASAQNSLGAAYITGKGLPAPDIVQAIAWLRKAADQREPNSMGHLAEIYMQGLAGPRNLIAAYAWLVLGHSVAKPPDKVQYVEGMHAVAHGGLGRSGIAHAKAMAEAWQPGVDFGASAVPADGRSGGVDPSSEKRHAGGGGSGTGFVVGKRGEVLTNAHVAADCGEITLHLAGGARATATAIALDRANDLALLSPALGILQPLAFRQGLPRAGDGVVSFGFPLGSLLATDGNVTIGNVTALAGFANDARMLQTTAPVQPGNSGGPLLDTSGNVIGVISSGLSPIKVKRGTTINPQNVNFAIKASVVQSFLEQQKIAYATAISTKELKPADIAEQVKRSTVVIECRR